MSKDLYRAIEALQNARDQLVIALADPIGRLRRIDCAVEDLRDVMKELGIKEAKTKDGN